MAAGEQAPQVISHRMSEVKPESGSPRPPAADQAPPGSSDEPAGLTEPIAPSAAAGVHDNVSDILRITWARSRKWIRELSWAFWVLLAAALLETIILGWVQWQNYLGFIPIQGNLGNYNQALYTTVHGQGFFYYTTNIPGGSNGSLWAIHFAPDLFILLPAYSLAPSPVTLILFKQLALALGALPVYGIAKTYFRRELLPFSMGALYLLSPLTITTDWNSFDLEPFFPLAVLLAIYFFSRGRTWPFLACWVLALGTIEATAPLLALFALGGLIGTYLARSSTPYWTAAQQRLPLFVGLVIALVWIGLSSAVLYHVGARGGGYGNAYAVRYTILGAQSLPDVLPRALTDPGAAGAALQYDGGRKILFIELLVISTGAIWLLGGIRYLFPLFGYLALALLSNNAAAYALGTEQPVLVLGFLFAGTIEGVVLLIDWYDGKAPDLRRVQLEVRLTREARELALTLKSLPTRQLAASLGARSHLRSALRFLGSGDLAKADRELRVAQILALPLSERNVLDTTAPTPNVEVGPTSSENGRPNRAGTQLTRRFGVRNFGGSSLAAVALLSVLIIPAMVIANPFLSAPVGHAPGVQFGYVGPNAADQALQDVLNLIPPRAAVLTTSHIFPQLSNRPNAFVVPSEGARIGSGNISSNLDFWANQSQYIVIDYAVDPVNSVILRNDTNLGAFGIYAADDGAVAYERGWQQTPVLWSPFVLSMSGGSMQINQKAGRLSPQYASDLGPAFFHPAGGVVGTHLWGGPEDVYLPRGAYNVTFNVLVATPSKGPTLVLNVTKTVAFVYDKLIVTVSGIPIRQALVERTYPPQTATVASKTVTAAAAHGLEAMALTLSFIVNSTASYNFSGVSLSPTMSMFLVSVVLVQSAPLI
jgi:uncharacterized membrane protein